MGGASSDAAHSYPSLKAQLSLEADIARELEAYINNLEDGDVLHMPIPRVPYDVDYVAGRGSLKSNSTHDSTADFVARASTTAVQYGTSTSESIPSEEIRRAVTTEESSAPSGAAPGLSAPSPMGAS